jgi:hypothetical protein
MPGLVPGIHVFGHPFQRIDAAGRHQDFVAALVEFGAVIFHRRGERRMRLPGLCQINGAFGHGGKRRLVDVERGDLAAQHGVVEPAGIIASNGVGGDLPKRTADTALASARDHRALVLQQILCNIPAAVDGADHMRFRHAHIVEKSFAERRIARDQENGLGRHALRGHVEQDETDAVMLLRRGIGAHQAKNPVGVVGV